MNYCHCDLITQFLFSDWKKLVLHVLIKWLYGLQRLLIMFQKYITIMILVIYDRRKLLCKLKIRFPVESPQV